MGIKKFGRVEQSDDLFRPTNSPSRYTCSFVFAARDVPGMQSQTEISRQMMGGNMGSAFPLT